ncbi:MAG: two-component system response regulator [Ilumatobacter sp.]
MSSEQPEEQGEQRKRVRCVALIDDNPADNYLHRLVAERSGLVEQVVDFVDPRDALEALVGNQLPDNTLVLLDIRMPHLDGFEFLEEFELRGRHRSDVVVMMLSTSLLPEDQERARSFGAVEGFLQKPLTAKIFRDIVDTHYPLD